MSNGFKYLAAGSVCITLLMFGRAFADAGTVNGGGPSKTHAIGWENDPEFLSTTKGARDEGKRLAKEQPFDEAAVTAQARVFGPKDTTGAKVGGIPVASIQWLLDREQIRDAINRYARGLDRHDKLLIASAFWPDAQINYGTDFTGLRDEFVHWVVADDAVKFIAHTHNMVNQIIEFDGNTAHVETYLIGIDQFRNDKAVQVIAFRYVDRYEKRNGEWRILVREVLIDTRGMLNHWKGTGWDPTKDCKTACGHQDKTDLSYKRPLEPRPMPNPGQKATSLAK